MSSDPCRNASSRLVRTQALHSHPVGSQLWRRLREGGGETTRRDEKRLHPTFYPKNATIVNHARGFLLDVCCCRNEAENALTLTPWQLELLDLLTLPK